MSFIQENDILVKESGLNMSEKNFLNVLVKTDKGIRSYGIWIRRDEIRLTSQRLIKKSYRNFDEDN